jgi:hypothetical protein
LIPDITVLDHAVLAGCIHGLEDQQDRPQILRVQLVLHLRQQLDTPRQQLGRTLLAGLFRFRRRIMVAQVELAAIVDALGFEEILQVDRYVFATHP